MLQAVRCVYETRERCGPGLGYRVMERTVRLATYIPLENSCGIERLTSRGALTINGGGANNELQAQELVGESNLPEEKETPYLLRAVGDANETFPLEPSLRPDGTVWVGGGANSKCPVPMQRRPFVAWLNRMPEKVYVTFYVNRD